MNEYTTFARRIGLVGITQIIINLRGIITLPILTKTLGASGYGVLAQILITISLLIQFLTLGLGASLVRFLPSKNNKEIVQGINTILITILFSGIIFSILLFFSSVFFANVFIKDSSATPAIQLAAVLLTLQALENLSINAFRVFGLIKRYSIVMISKTFLEICLIAFFVFNGYDVVGVMYAFIISESIFLVIILTLIFSYAGFAFPDFSLLRPYLAFGLPMIPIGIFEFIVASSDRYIIGFFHGASSVGIYSAAYNLGSLASVVGPYIIFILGPTIANLYDKKKLDSVKSHLILSFRYYLMLSIPSAFGLSILARSLLNILTTQEFVSIGIYVIPFVVSGVLFYGIYCVFAEALKLSKKTYIIAVAMSVGAITNFILNILIVPYWGAIGAAVTTLVAYLFAAIILFYKSRQTIKFKIEFIFIIKSIFASSIMVLIIWLLNPLDIFRVILSLLLGIIVYFFVLFLIKGIDKQEIKTILEIIGLKPKNKKN